MRLESKIQYNVRGKVFGGEKNLACIPMVAATREELVEETKLVASLNPDMIEWRVDYYEKAADAQYVKESFLEIAPLMNNIPVIFTFRGAHEGGAGECSEEERLATIKAALETGYADIVDVEASCEKEFIDEVKAAVEEQGSKLILSYHNFKETPSEEFILNKLKEEAEMGADILKIAVMPKDFPDVMTLMKATYRARTEAVDLPMITMSMAQIGKVSRVIGDLYGSDLSFVVGKNASAPGQIPIAVVNELWKLMA